MGRVHEVHEVGWRGRRCLVRGVGSRQGGGGGGRRTRGWLALKNCFIPKFFFFLPKNFFQLKFFFNQNFFSNQKFFSTKKFVFTKSFGNL